MDLKGLTCPQCGSQLSFSEDQDYCFCSHCGTQVYKDDAHFDRKMDYREHKLDVEKELEIAKLKKDEKESNMFMIIFGVIIVVGCIALFLLTR